LLPVLQGLSSDPALWEQSESHCVMRSTNTGRKIEFLLHEMESYRPKKSIHWITSGYRSRKAKYICFF